MIGLAKCVLFLLRSKKKDELTSLTNEEVCRLGNVGRMIWIVVWIPKLAVPLINTIGKAHQYIGGYLNMKKTHVSYNLFFVSDITSKHISRTSVNSQRVLP